MDSELIQMEQDGQVLGTGMAAIRALEAMISDHFCYDNHYDFDAHSRVSLNLFGRNFKTIPCGGSRATLSKATGLEMTGKRVAVLLDGDRLGKVSDVLTSLADRLVPLVTHVVCASGHQGLHLVSRSGAFQVFARNAQNAIDLCLVARQVAELSLSPGLVAMDALETAGAPSDFSLPDAGLLERFIRGPMAEIPSATKAQHYLFGGNRPQIPSWFHLDRPVAQGWKRVGVDHAVAQAGRKLFFQDQVTEFAREAMSMLSSVTGRPLDFITRYKLEDADHVLVALGSAVETAEAVANYLRTAENLAVGVLGIMWVRPFPSKEVADALARARNVAVLERMDPGSVDFPLHAEIKSLVPKGAPLITATYGVGGQPFTAAQVAALCRSMAGKEPPQKVYLGVTQSDTSLFPKRDISLKAVKRDYPALARHIYPEAEALDVRPGGAKTAVVFGHRTEAVALTDLARGLAGEAGTHIRASAFFSENDFWTGRVTASFEPFGNPGSETPINTAFITRLDLPASLSPLKRMVHDGFVIFASLLEKEALLQALPIVWRNELINHHCRAFLFQGSGAELIAAAPGLLNGVPTQLDELDLNMGESLSTPDWEPDPPRFLRGITEDRATYDSIPRFWNEVLQPGMEGEGSVPNPSFSLGEVPCGTAAFADRTPVRQTVPWFDPAKCSGCGDCWVTCPDSAFGVTALSTEKLLDAVATLVDEPVDKEVAGKLKRASKNLASRVNTLLTKSGAATLSEELLWEAFDWLIGKMKIKEEEIPNYKDVFAATCRKLMHLPVSATTTLFSEQNKVKKGSGALLVLTVNPKSCQGCGICVETCPDAALEMAPQSAEKVSRLAEVYSSWENLPDTAGATVEAFRSHETFSRLAANFMSRSCAYTISGGDCEEPGSGVRIAIRLITGTAEFLEQKQMQGYGQRLTEVEDQLKKQIQKILAEALPISDLPALKEALSRMPAHRSTLMNVIKTLDEKGRKSSLDAQKVKRFTELAQEVQGLYLQLSQGVNGIGRARYGLVLASSKLDGLTCFPHNAFQVPAVANRSGNGAELAMGIMEGVIGDHVAEIKRIRFMELAARSGPEVAEQDKALKKLTWSGLTAEEKDLCPKVILGLGDEVLSTSALGGLSRLLASDWPVKVLLLDTRERFDRVDPVTLALAHARPFVLSSSLSHLKHLSEGLEPALAFNGPALIHLYTPSPNRHGFASRLTIDRTRLAVETGLHPLVQYDPEVDGIFGARVKLAGNLGDPPLKETIGEDFTIADWAAGESRFAAEFTPVSGADTKPLGDWLALDARARAEVTPHVTVPSGDKLVVGMRLRRAALERATHLKKLREIAGLDSPFITRIRTQVEAEVKKQYETRLAEAKASHQTELDQLEARQKEAMTLELSKRLIGLTELAAKRGFGEEGQ